MDNLPSVSPENIVYSFDGSDNGSDKAIFDSFDKEISNFRSKYQKDFDIISETLKLEYPRHKCPYYIKNILRLLKHDENFSIYYVSHLENKIDIFKDYVREVPQLKGLLVPLQEHLGNINELLTKLCIKKPYKYFLFFNMTNPFVSNFFSNTKITPGIFKLYKINSSRDTQNMMDVLRKDFFQNRNSYLTGVRYRNHYDNSIYWNKYYNTKYNNFVVDSSDHEDDVFSDINFEEIVKNDPTNLGDPQWKKYSGWNRQSLLDAIETEGIFTSKTQWCENPSLKYLRFPKLEAIGIPPPIAVSEPKTEKMFLNYLPKYMLETIYSQTVDTTVNWDEVFSLNPPMLAVQKLIKEEFGVRIEGSLDELKFTVSIMLRNKQLSEVLPEIVKEFLSDPGTKENPRVQYLKSAQGLHLYNEFPVYKINIERYFEEILKNDPEESARNIGLERLTQGKPKEEILKIINKYLDIIRTERIL